MIVGALATTWTTPPVALGAAGVVALSIAGVAVFRREVLALD